MLFMVMALAVAAQSVEVTGADTVSYAGRTYRLYDVDAPQIGAYARCPGEAARAQQTQALVRTLIAGAAQVEIRPGFDPRGRRSWPSDRYGRRLADIRIDGRDLGQLLIEQGRATPWDNHDNHDWCRG